MNINISYHRGEYTRDLDKTPSWSEKIPRWSQLDDASYIVAEASSLCSFNLKKISQVYFVSNQGSNTTDFNFVNKHNVSAQSFVHTLPNVRALSFSLITGWQGPLWCLSFGEKTLVNLLKQIDCHQDQSLIISFNRNENLFFCDFIVVGGESYTHQLINVKNDNDLELLINDSALRSQLTDQGPIQITPSLELRKKL